jgi:hypothetical protein
MRVSRIAQLGIAGAAAFVAGWTSMTAPSGDYARLGLANPNNAAPFIDAVLRGDLAGAVHDQPVMGLTSLVVRLPFAGLGRLIDGRLLEYRLGALVCALALAVIAVALAVTGLRRGLWVGAISAAALLLFNLNLTGAISAGHPEELLGAGLATAAVAAAATRRPTAAGILLGAAVGTKPWALLAAVPVLLASVDIRRTIVAAAAAGAIALAPLPALSPGRFVEVNQALGATRRVYGQSAWSLVAVRIHRIVQLGSGEHRRISVALLPGGLNRGRAGLVVLPLAAGLGLLLKHRRPLALPHALALLAFLLLARTMLDPANLRYYAIPFLTAMAVWEGLHWNRLPLVGMCATTCLWLSFRGAGTGSTGETAFFLLWSSVLAVWLWRATTRSPATCS